MTTYKPNPTYYRVIWNSASPNDYTALTGTQSGGLDNVSPIAYNRKISITGNASITSNVMTTGDSLLINNQEIAFISTDLLADIITTINMYRPLTNVIAHNAVSSTYVTLANANGFEGEPIQLAEGTGALAKLGITAGVYTDYPNAIGTSWTDLNNGANVTINDVTVTFTTAGGLDLTGAVDTINSYTNVTGVSAIPAAGNLQLTSTVNHPIYISGPNVSTIGFTAGPYGGSPSTIDQSTRKALANLRWQQVINQLEIFATPFMLGDVFATGNYDGSGNTTTFGFTVGYEHPDQILTVALPGEYDAGTTLTGTAAIKRAVARGLAAVYNCNVNLFDPTIEVRNSLAVRANPVRVVNLTATGIGTTGELADLEDNISVAMITYE